MSLWLTLAELEDFSLGDFRMHHVLQNGEYRMLRESISEWIVCHYYSQNMERFDRWIRAFNARTASDGAASRRPRVSTTQQATAY